MATAPTIIRRYTPPTCALEITAQPSALSRWMGKVALKDVRFKLSFDDPRMSDDAWIVLRGDRAQLEGLHTTVSDYVQSFLMRVPALPTATVERDIAAQTAVSATDLATSIAPSTGITIHPKGLLGHELALGSLATEQSGATLQLSSTQLADLAAALDEYSAEATTLPQLTGQTAWLPDLTQWSSPNWAGLAAGVLVAVGLGTSFMNGLSRQSPSSGTANQASSSDQRLAVPSVSAVPPTSESFATLPPLAALPSPGSNINPTGTAPGLNGSTMPNSTPSAPIIASQPSSGTQSPVNIFEIPQPAAPQVAAPSAPANPSSSSTNPPLPVIVDDIGSGVAVEPIPDMTQADASIPNRTQAERAEASKPSAQAQAPAASSLGRNRAAESQNQAAEALASSGDNNFMGNAQAAAVQSYFQQRWQPQKDLKQGIQYEIQLNPDGSLKQAKPIGTVAEQFQAKTGIPAVGTPLAPADQDGQSAVVRLLLDPDGSVQAIPQ